MQQEPSGGPPPECSTGLETPVSEAEWAERLQAIDVDHATMNRLVMDYLIIEGHKEAAECFMEESGTDAGVDLETVGERMAIRTAIESGDVEHALERVRGLDPNILSANPDLRFRLQQLLTIEMIRAGKTEQAIECAQRELAPLVEEAHHLLPELERTMMLLAYGDAASSPEAALLSQEHRQEAASALNAAILAAQDQQSESRLPMMLRMLQWAQDELALRHAVTFPRIDDLAEAVPVLAAREAAD
mmetsp:Transcript_71439/g.214753  ORF Transcript_71439/g.214753 Transcript_71439/m.214753 type:complete len:246 (+) Transcript_71439:52-789(+)